MKILLTILCAFLMSLPAPLYGERPKKIRAIHNTTPGVFDFYLLNLSWAPEYCASHTGAECTQHLGFVVHGLWPQNHDGSYPQSCSNAPGPANYQQYTDLVPDVSLLKHEWSVHGTCSGLAPDAYFTLDRKAFHQLVIPKLLKGLDHAVQMKPADLTALFQAANPAFPAGSIAVTCLGNQLNQVEACLTKNGLKPEVCQAVTACHAQTIQILPQTTGAAAR